MKPVSDSTSQPLPRTDSALNQERVSRASKIAVNSSSSQVTSEQVEDKVFEFALGEVRSHSDEVTVDLDKIKRLKAQIESGQHPAQSSENSSFFDSLADKILSTEYDIGK